MLDRRALVAARGAARALSQLITGCAGAPWRRCAVLRRL